MLPPTPTPLVHHHRTTTRGVARHNFKRRQLSPPRPKNGGPEVQPPEFFFGILHCCRRVWVATFLENETILHFFVTVGEFWYIFGERKQTFLSPKTRSRGIVPGRIFEFCIAVKEFDTLNFLEDGNKFSSPLKRGSGVLSPGKISNSALL